MKKLEISSGKEGWSFDVQQQERGVMLNELRESGRLGALLQRPEVTGRQWRKRRGRARLGLAGHKDSIFFFHRPFSEVFLFKKKMCVTKTQETTETLQYPSLAMCSAVKLVPYRQEEHSEFTSLTVKKKKMQRTSVTTRC